MRSKNEKTPTAPTDEVSNLSATSKELTNMSISSQITTINVPFHGDNLYLVAINNEPFVPMRPVVEGMGLAWGAQFVKLKQRFNTSVSEIETQLPGDSQRRKVTCLALRKLAGWLHTINVGKVRPELRDKVARYQEECDDVLYQYWTKGQVTNPRKVKKALPGKITVDQQEAIKQLVLTRGKSVPQECQAKATITLWSSLKSHFGCSYKEISEDQFTEALSLVARVPIDGEFIGKQPQLPKAEMVIDYPLEWFQQNSDCTDFRNMKVGTDRVMMTTDMLIEGPSAALRLLNYLRDNGYDITAPYMEVQTLRHIMLSMRRTLNCIQQDVARSNNSAMTFRL